MPKIDDLGGVIAGHQPVEQSHLPVHIANRSCDRVPGHKLCERPFARIEVERDNLTVFTQMEVCQQPRDQRFSHARARRCDNGDGVAK